MRPKIRQERLAKWWGRMGAERPVGFRFFAR